VIYVVYKELSGTTLWTKLATIGEEEVFVTTKSKKNIKDEGMVQVKIEFMRNFMV
jgi:hypothetical protein